MSLLLDARKKSVQTQPSHEAEIARKDNAATRQATLDSREAGRNLFAAKNRPTGFALPSQRLLLALGATVLLVTATLGYLWRLDSAASGTTTPEPPIDTRIVLSPPIGEPPAEPQAAQQADAPAAKPAPPAAEQAFEPAPARPTPKQSEAADGIHIAHPKAAAVEPVLASAYQAYGEGRLDDAQRQYLALLGNRGHDTDALLGLAAIAQRKGESFAASQYYARVLERDPRNPVANAGMAALNTDGDSRNESRLKSLLRDQPDSAVLHFALGNLYAEQSRWGEAQQAYFNAWTQTPESADIAYNLAVSLDHLGQSAQAIRYYRHALQAASSAGLDRTGIERRIEKLSHTGK